MEIKLKLTKEQVSELKSQLGTNGKVNGVPCFEWMERWINAFEKANEEYEGVSKKIKEWINEQPMSQ